MRIVAGISGNHLCVVVAREEGAQLERVCEESEIVCACRNGDWEISIDEIVLLGAGEGYTNP